MLYKYCALNEYTLSSLIERTLWFANPTHFNDPVECKFEILDSDPERIKAPCGLGLELVVEKFTALREGREFDSFAEYRIRLIRALTEIGVLCLAAEGSNTLMWSHYADHHRGLCLGFRLKPSPDYPVQAVAYGGDFPSFALESFADEKAELVRAIMFQKAEDWAYEREYRIVVDVPDGDDSGRARPWPDFLELEEVRFGLRMPGWARETIRRVLSDAPATRFVEMVQKPGKLAVVPETEADAESEA